MVRNWLEKRHSKQTQVLTFGCLDRLLNCQAILPIQRKRFFDDQMLSGCGGGNRMLRMVLRIAADRDDMDIRILPTSPKGR